MYRAENDEVYYTHAPFGSAGAADIAFLKAQAARNPRRRARICFHENPDAAVHEMLIIHHRDVYVRPHRHRAKHESLHVLEGAVTAVMLAEDGALERALHMAAGGEVAYYRMPPLTWHTLIIRSEWLVFMEVTQGPFLAAQSEFAPWAPDGTDAAAARAYLADLDARVRAFGPVPAR